VQGVRFTNTTWVDNNSENIVYRKKLSTTLNSTENSLKKTVFIFAETEKS